jgi:regulation of enolase protein 1 (concanavalin A-like superfamily)
MKTNMRLLAGLGSLLFALPGVGADSPLFRDEFKGGLGAEWTWIREDKAAWRVAGEGLELRILPGNLWGGANNAKNVLVRPAPDTAAGPVEVSVTITNSPVHQYEQANLAWYYNDSHMVKLGLELVDRQVCIVMGREQADRMRTLAKIAVTGTAVRVRMRIEGNRISGEYRMAGTDAWLKAGEGDLPAPDGGRAHISLHAYQGDPNVEHWARFSDFRIERPKP